MVAHGIVRTLTNCNSNPFALQEFNVITTTTITTTEAGVASPTSKLEKSAPISYIISSSFFERKNL